MIFLFRIFCQSFYFHEFFIGLEINISGSIFGQPILSEIETWVRTPLHYSYRVRLQDQVSFLYFPMVKVSTLWSFFQFLNYLDQRYKT